MPLLCEEILYPGNRCYMAGALRVEYLRVPNNIDRVGRKPDRSVAQRGAMIERAGLSAYPTTLHAQHLAALMLHTESLEDGKSTLS